WELVGPKDIKQDRTFEGYGTVAFSHDGRYLAFPANKDHAVHLWDLEEKKELAALPPQEGYVGRVAFGPGGMLASTSTSAVREKAGKFRVRSQLRVWNLTTGKEVWSLVRTQDQFVGMEFDAESNRLVVGSSDGSLSLLDGATGRELRPLVGHA